MRIRTLALALLVSMSPLALDAQQRRASPHESVAAEVGGATVTVTYGRPFMRGRAIFGALVPYGHVWCPGADEATTLDSTRPLEVAGVNVPAGPHTIWILPTEATWTLVISSEASGFHLRYPEGSDLGRVALTKRALDAPVDQLTFAVAATAAGGTLAMSWERTEVSVPFRVVK
jgi:hypothetical protein